MSRLFALLVVLDLAAFSAPASQPSRAATAAVSNVSAASTAPGAWFEAYRLAASSREDLALERLRSALRADPENPFLNWARIDIGVNGPERRYLEADYRAFLEEKPASAMRKLFLAAALARIAQDRRAMFPDAERLASAKSLLDGVPESREYEPWRSMAAGSVGGGDRQARNAAIDAVWAASPGHPAIAVIEAARARGDEAKLLPIVLRAARREPRVVHRMLAGHVPPLDPNAAGSMAELLDVLTKSAATASRDVDVQISLRAALFLAGRAKELPAVDERIARLDPGFTLPAPRAPEAAGNDSQEALMAAMMAEPAKRLPALEAFLKRPNLSTDQALTANRFLASAASELEPPDRELERAASARAIALGASDPFFLAQYARAAAETGKDLEAAGRLLEAALDRALAGDPPPQTAEGGGIVFIGGPDQDSGDLAQLLGARAVLRRRRGDDRGARGDLRLAAALQPQAARTWAELADVEEKLGHVDEALAAWTQANARPSGKSARPEWKARLASAASRRHLWAKGDDLVAAAQAALSTSGGVPKLPAHLLVGKPAPAFDLPALGDGRASLAPHAGKAVVVDFWATWCKPCREEMKALAPIVDDYTKKGVVFLALSTDSDDDWTKKVPGFVKDNAVTMVVGHADDDTQASYRVNGIPALVLVGRDGAVVRYWSGYYGGLDRELEEALAAALK